MRWQMFFMATFISGIAQIQAEEKPLLTIVLNEENGASTILAIDDQYQVKYFLTKIIKKDSGGGRRILGFGLIEGMRFETEQRKEIVDPNRMAIAVQLSPFSIAAVSTNIGYSFAMTREGKVVPSREVNCNIFEYPNGKGIVAIFYTKDLENLPHSEAALGHFYAEEIKKMISDGRASLANDQSSKTEIVP